jgi:D-alanyl-lipoteichoic acid acyltransferase DltB (MBOAT superfamily)
MNLIRRRLPVALILAGIAAALVAFGSDLLGIGAAGGFGTKQLGLAAGGGLLLGLGLALDWRGARRLPAWARAAFADRRTLAQAAAVAGQFLLLLWLANAFALENRAFHHTLLWLTFFGFVIHHLLPPPLRLPFFSLLSAVAIFAILGLTPALWLLGAAALLIGVTYLPIPFGWRVGVLLALGVLLGVLRAGLFDSPVPPAVWPLLGSFFMFRLIVFMYDLRHAKQRPAFFLTLAYFLLLPNVVFPLFPVVDFSAFRRTHYNHPDPIPIYQTGIRWMFRGMLHLIAYRIVNYNFIIPAGELTDAVSFAQLMLANFLLYLRVSGQFHIIIGLLHLFGFNLPESHHLYWLAPSFTELWRRINIYWKDFMQKVVFYPLMVRFKRLPEARRLALATLLSFAATWALHVYQWFWLRGSLFISLPDIVFWIILAVLVMFTILRDNRRGKKEPVTLAARTLQTTTLFFTMIVLWYMWSSPSLSEWWEVVRFVEYTPHSLLLVGAGMLALTALMGGLVWLEQRAAAAPPPPFHRSAAATALAAAALLVFTQPAINARLPVTAQAFIAELRVQRLSSRDAQLLERGYYEDLTGIDKFNSDLWEIYLSEPTDWPALTETEVARMLPGSFLNYDLRPNVKIFFRRDYLSTNEWGMRDLPYTLDKPANTFRIALLGSSRDMGAGVGDTQTFETIIENELNAKFTGQPYDQYQILNFSIGGYSMLQKLYFLQNRNLFDFQPDIVIITPNAAHEDRASFLHLYQTFSKGIDIPYPYLLDLLDRAGVTPGMGELEALDRLMPLREEMLAWVFQSIADEIRAHGTVPVILHYPDPKPEYLLTLEQDTAEIRTISLQAGYQFIDLSGVFTGISIEAHIIAPWDSHPNPAGHQLLARWLYKALIEQGIVPVTTTP